MGGYDKFYEFLRELHKKEREFQLKMLEDNEISAEEFGTDEEIFDHMIDWFVEDVVRWSNNSLPRFWATASKLLKNEVTCYFLDVAPVCANCIYLDVLCTSAR